MIKAVLRLRRDNDYNYAKIKDSFIPANGEICLVDTARDGLRAVCGDGVSTFGQLKYIDGAIVRGYLQNGVFYEDKELTIQNSGIGTKLYLNLLDSKFYYFDNNAFIPISAEYNRANETTEGIMKLYSTVGENEDGTMTQKAITKELNEKVEMAVDMEDELLVLSYDIN